MRILIVTPHFYPESFKCNDMAFEMARRGHEVSVLTAIPDYPYGRFFDGYGVFKRRREKHKGVQIYRSLIIARGNGSPVRLALNYLSYTFFVMFSALWLSLTKKFDSVIVYETSPVMVGIPGVIVKRIQKIPMLFYVQDLWPESLSAAGGIRNRRILGIFERLTSFLYRQSDRILISSRGFSKSVCSKGSFSDKIIYFPNWIDDIQEDVTDVEIPSLPTGFRVMFAGNMGDAQDMPSVMSAAEQLKDHAEIKFIFLGEGRKKSWVESHIMSHGLEKTVYCLGRFPLQTMPYFFRQADVLFLSLKDTEIFSLTVPSRVQAYMAAGKPVVAMLNGEGSSLISEADCGYSVNAGDSSGLASLILQLSVMPSDELAVKGANGKKYSERYYDFRTCMDNLEKIICSIS